MTTEPYALKAASDELLVNLAGSLASLHAARDFHELAGLFERLGERCVGAALTVLLLSDDSGGYRPVTGSLRRPAVVESLREGLGVDLIGKNQEVAFACHHVEATSTPAWFDVGDLFAEAEAATDNRRCVIVPIGVAGEGLGAGLFVVSESRTSATFSSILAEHAGVAVKRLRELDQARRLRGIDSELWIAGEASLRESLATELSRARRYGGSVGLTLLRIDCEGDLRTKYGHFYTDHMLRRVGGFLRSAIRDTDVLGTIARRFAVIHPATAREGSGVAAERLTEAIGSMLSKNYPELELSLIARISADCVASPADGVTVNELIECVLAQRDETGLIAGSLTEQSATEP